MTKTERSCTDRSPGEGDLISSHREGSFTTVVNTDGDLVDDRMASKSRSATISQMGISFSATANAISNAATDMLMWKNVSITAVVGWPRRPRVRIRPSDQINSDLIGLILLAVVNLGLIGVTIGGNTIASLRRLSVKAEAMADGELDVDLDTSREDEFGTLYAAFDNMRANLRTQISEAETAKQEAEAAKEQAQAAREDVESERNEWRR